MEIMLEDTRPDLNAKFINLSKMEAVLFDFDGTLVNFVDADIQSLKNLHSLSRSKSKFEDFLETSVEEVMEFHNLVQKKQIDPLLMHEFRLINTFMKHQIEWDDRYVNFYKNELIRNCIPFHGIERILSKTREKAKTGLITNAYDGKEQRERIGSSGLDGYFDIIVIAGEVGIYKPNPEIFLYVCNCLRIAPNNSLYIGDSIAHDIVGAKLAGMKTVLFSPIFQRSCESADYVVRGVDELSKIIEFLL